MLKYFRKYTPVEVMQAELEELEGLRYQEDRRCDYHAAQVEGYDKRIAKLRDMLAANGK
jgi:hypothetical protein